MREGRVGRRKMSGVKKRKDGDCGQLKEWGKEKKCRVGRQEKANVWKG